METTTTKIWTLEEIKRVLPTVKVKLVSGKIVTGYVRGRELDYPVVNVFMEQTYLRVCEVSWEAYLRCVNSGSPLIV